MRGWWLAIGLFAGLAMASKYTAALLWFGIALWLLVTPIDAALAAAACACGLAHCLGLAAFLPVLLWEARHGWPSFARQGAPHRRLAPIGRGQISGELAGGQAGLVTPLIFAFCVGGVVKAARQAWRTRDPAWTLLAS